MVGDSHGRFHLGLYQLGLWIGGSCCWLECRKCVRTHMTSASVELVCWLQTGIWRQKKIPTRSDLGSSSCFYQSWWLVGWDSMCRHCLHQKRLSRLLQIVGFGFQVRWNWKVCEQTASMFLLTFYLNQVADKIIVLAIVQVWFLLVKSKNCEITGGAGVCVQSSSHI